MDVALKRLTKTICAYSILMAGGWAEASLAGGNYLGQQEPGDQAEKFAPNLVSLDGFYEFGITFSPALDEVYFSRQKDGSVAAIYGSKLVSGQWQPLKKASFTAQQKAGEMEPFITLDGKKMFFTAYNADFSDTKIWVADRRKDGWGDARKLKSPINDAEVFNSTVAQNGDLYFTDIFKGQTFVAKNEGAGYPSVEQVNLDFGLHPYISPAQDFLLVDAVAKDRGRKDKDIYVYFKQDDGTWSQPVNLGEAVNSELFETVPSVTPDGRYLFFSRYDGEDGSSNIYWVSTKVIYQLKESFKKAS